MITQLKEKEIYELIAKEKEKFGKFNKAIFHLHTPASYDYCLYEENRNKSEKDKDNYKNLTDDDLYDIAIKEKLFFDKGKLTYNKNIFSSTKEYISYLLIADKLIKNNIKTVVLSDHNTIKGYKKLTEAISIHKRCMITECYPEIILGIEISCADLNHIVGMFDKNSYEKVQDFIEQYIMDEQKGTYLSSIDVIEKINEINGYFYIAHINTSDIFKKDFLSSGYKEKLFSIPELKIVGISDKEQKEIVKRNLKKYAKNKEFNFILDTDSHSIDTICSKIVWIKGKKTDFRIIKDLYRDYEITVSLDKPKEVNQYIKGIVIENDEENFLCSKKYVRDYNDKYLVMNFSHSLNCIIGGRGSGKSTILNIIEFLLSLQVNSPNNLEMICRHKCIWLVYKHKSKEYIIKLLPPKKEFYDDDIMKCFETLPDGYITYKSKFIWNEEKVKRYTLNNYMELYEVYKEKNGNIDIKKYRQAKMTVLEKFFKKAYSINELVKIAGNEHEINDYISNLIFQNEDLKRKNRLANANTLKQLKNNIEKLSKIKQSRNNQVNEIIKKYNILNKKNLRITYSQNQYINLSKLNLNIINDKGYIKVDGKVYNIKAESIIYYFYFLISEIGILDFLKLLIDKDIEQMLKIEDIDRFEENFTQKEVNMGIEQVSKANSKIILSGIIEDIVVENRSREINNLLKEYINNMDEFSLEFNVNSNNSGQKDIFRNIQKLSLGQKVVAMLTFILSYSDFSNDYTPLIIDQPEDNLDSQYIYYNLVEELKKVKEKRQVIIATHNSTIVTNAKTENIIVMKSNNEMGWIEDNGYPTEPKILKSIVKYLEGGKESFNHKKSLYEEIL